MKLIVELTTEDAIDVLNGLNLEEIVITTTDGSATDVAKPKRKRRTRAEIEADEKAAEERAAAVAKAEELKEEAVAEAQEASEKLDEKIAESAKDAADTLGESFSAGASPWAS
jgi:type II secretory pathway component HofQ